MGTRHEVDERTDGLGHHLEFDGGSGLPALTARLNELCDRVEEQPQAVVVLRPAAGTGEDRSWPGRARIQDVNRWERAVRRLERSPAVSIAVASGTCAGPALDLLLAADYRIAGADLRLLLPVNDGHFWPGTGIHRLVTQLGAARARQLVLWGTELTAERSLGTGLVDEVADDVPDAVRTATVWLGRAAGAELAVRRALLLAAGATPYEDALGMHLAACDRELRRLTGGGTGAPPPHTPAGPGPAAGPGRDADQ
ncbi:enoyl-CoA-hydratase DpgB [Streptomyces sp. NPDC060223]|uniref:enoyl-CoA-hydratase DpgB n=1 Tax=unclassified Streptomyces TaxID=2593676 RepID=UPI003636B277